MTSIRYASAMPRDDVWHSSLCLAVATALLVLGHVSEAAAQVSSADRVATLKQMNVAELSTLEVFSVSKEPEPYGQAPSAIQVITQDEIRRSGATSVPEVLRLAGNLAVARKNAHGWAISARGFNTDLANKLLVMIDGRTVYTPLFSGVFWDRQDYLLEDIHHIEVISGPGSTLWGANAVNGIINIITKRAQDSQGFYAEVGGGPTVEGLTGIRYGGTLAPNVSYRVYGKYAGHGDESLPSGNEATDSWRMGSGGIRIDADPSPRNSFTLQSDVYQGRDQLPLQETARVSGGNVLGRWSHTSSGDSDFTAQVYYDRTHLLDPIPVQILNTVTIAAAGDLQDDLDTFDVDFHQRFRLTKRHRLSWGLGYRATHDVVENAPALGFVPPVLNQSLFSGFVQDEIALARTLSFIAGTKVEHNDYTGFELEPSGRLQWSVTEKHVLWGAISRAIRAPARVDRDERLATPGLSPVVENLLIGGPTFTSETVVAFELGSRVQFGPTVFASISAFYNRYNDLRSTSLSAPDPVFHLPFPLFFENNLEGNTYGIELSATNQVLNWWRLRSSYAFLGEDIRVKPGRFDFNNALNETADPRHRFTLHSSMNVTRRLGLDAGLRWVGSFLFNMGGVPGTVPSYAEVDARLAWHASGLLELSLVGQNLLHDRHLEYVISGSNPREEIRRNIYAKAAFRW